MIDTSKLSLEDLYNLRKKVNHEIRARLRPAPKQNLARRKTDAEICKMHVGRIAGKLNLLVDGGLDYSEIQFVLTGLKRIADLDPLKMTVGEKKTRLSEIRSLMGRHSDSTEMINAAGANQYFKYLGIALGQLNRWKISKHESGYIVCSTTF